MQATATTFMEWNSSWVVGIREVDAQHKNLVSLVNGLYDAMSRGEGKKILRPILAELVKYTKAHFAAEEDIMRRTGYREFVPHKQEHDRFTAQALEFQRNFENGSVLISGQVLDFLRVWLRDHILGTDKKYVPFLQSKGVR
jgi:hemerythrin